MDDLAFLDSILQADKYGWIGKPQPKTSATRSTEADIFLEIITFYREHQREPNESGDAIEFKLSIQLEKLRANSALIDELIALDEFGLLTTKEIPEMAKREEFETLEDIMNSDLMEMLSPRTETASDIFEIKNVTDPEIFRERKKAEEIGKTVPCPNFEIFKPIFESLQKDLKSGVKTLKPTVTEEVSRFQFVEGNFYVIKGMLAFIDYVSEAFEGVDRVDYRLKLIYENGTQSNILLRSFGKALRADTTSQTILNSDGSEFNAKRVKGSEESDPRMQVYAQSKATGYIYIAKTQKPDLRDKYKHLYKIGLTKRDVSKRFKEAAKDPAFLMSDAEQIKIIPLNGLNLNSVESALHALFGQVRLDIEVVGNEGKTHKPKEWFMVPLEIIDQVISLIQQRTIHLYHYDPDQQKIIKR